MYGLELSRLVRREALLETVRRLHPGLATVLMGNLAGEAMRTPQRLSRAVRRC